MLHTRTLVTAGFAGVLLTASGCWPFGPTFCDSSTCSGCCSGDVCFDGTADDACGQGGADCASCFSAGESCQSQACVAGGCGYLGASCATDSDCCVGYFCPNGGGQCYASCVQDQGSCSSPADCCNGLSCNNGICTSSCTQAFDTCSPWASTCCSGLACMDLSGNGSYACHNQCGLAGTACGGSLNPCCAGFTCGASGTCEGGTAATCLSQGQGCTQNGTPCCSQLTCTSGSCQPTSSIPVGTCGNQTVSGGDQGISQTFDLGQSPATFVFSWNTYSIPDRIVVSHDGSLIYDTGCTGTNLPSPNDFGSGSQTLTFSGGSSQVVVTVTPDCDGETQTAWDFTVGCAQ